MSVRATPMATEEGRLQLLRAGVHAELLTGGWVLVEAGVAFAAGVASRSALLVAFGLDSIIELLSGVVVLWRLSVEASGQPRERVERAERVAAWTAGVALILLSFYIVMSAGRGLIVRAQPEASPAGIGLAAAALVVMPLLARAKRRIAGDLEAASLRGDAACSTSCAAMAGAMLAGLVLNAALRWWWAEYLALLTFLYWLLPEAWATLRSASAGDPAPGCARPSCGARCADPE